MSEEPKKRGRPLGAKSKFPAHSKMRDEFLKHNFDIIKEWVELYRVSHEDTRAKLITDVWGYAFPKRKPEDGAGDSSESPVVAFVPSDDQLLKLVEAARKK